MNKEYKNSKSFDSVFCDTYTDEKDIADYLAEAFNSYSLDGNFGAFYRSLEMSAKSKKINLEKYNLKSDEQPPITTLKEVFNALGVDFTLKSA